MKYSRREALSLLCTSSVASVAILEGTAEAGPSPTPATRPRLTDTKISILGLADAYETVDQTAARARSLRALAHIARQQQLVENNKISPQAAADEIRKTVQTEVHFDQDTFSEFNDFLTITKDEIDTTKDLTRPFVSGILLGAGAILTFPESELVLGGLALMGDSAITLYGPSAIESVWPQASDNEVLGLSYLANKKFLDAVRNSDKAIDMSIALYENGTVTLDPRINSSELTVHLPEPAQQALEPALEDSPDPGKVEKSFRDALSSATQSLNDKVQEQLDQPRTELNDVVKTLENQKRQDEIQTIAQDINSVGAIGNLLFSKVFNNPDVGQKLQGFATAAASIFVALATPGLGPLAIAGALAGAANSLLHLFSGGDPLLDTLKDVDKKIDQVLQGVQVILNTQADILADLKKIYQAIQQNASAIADVQGTVDVLLSGVALGSVADLEKAISSAVSDFAGLSSSNPPAVVASDKSLRTTYNQALSHYSTVGCQDARDSRATANYGSGYSKDNWIKLFRAGYRCDNMVGALITLANELKISLPQYPNDDLRSGGPVCPTVWAHAARAYLETRLWGPKIENTKEEDQLKDFWNAGQFLRELIITMTSPEAFDAIRRKLLETIGAVSFPPPPALPFWFAQQQVSGINALIVQFYGIASYRSSTVFPATQKIQVRGLDLAFPPGPSGVTFNPPLTASGRFFLGTQNTVWVQPGQPPQMFPLGTVVDYDPDYFQVLLDSKLVSKIPVQVPPGSAGFNSFVFTVNVPPPDPKAPPNPLNGINNIFSTPVQSLNNRWVYPWLPAVTPPTQPTDPMWFLPNELQKTARYWASGLYYRPLVAAEIAKGINAFISSYQNADYEFWGEALRVMGSFLQWRSQPVDQPNDVYGKTPLGPYNLIELAARMGEQLPNRLSFDGDWVTETAMLPGGLITGTVEGFRAQAATLPRNKSVSVVDQTLRKLGGYMIARGFSVPNLQLTKAA